VNIPFSKVRSWLFDSAWPFWAIVGVDRVHGGFVEHLDLQGRDGGAPFKRVRAQARQLYCFSHAAVLGFSGAREISDHGWAFLNAHGRRADGGWVRRMGREGGILDATSDAYDLAFVLFAHAWRYRLTQDPAVIESAIATVEALDRDLAHANGLGWLAHAGDLGPRQQNPHMHIIEAAIELADATGHRCFHELGRTIATLLRDRFLDRNRGVLYETFEQDWSTLATSDGRIVEPGHHLEWVWILLRAERILGIPLREEADILYRFACRYGADPVTGLIYDQIDALGVPLVKDSRSWPQTEALKAHLAMLEVHGLDTRLQIGRTVDNIFLHYLEWQPYGTWVDHRRHDGRPRVDKIPSTTLYHLQLAFTELLRLQPTIEAYRASEESERHQ
jgi:mannose/cellobiose epimerase-like protein (N-acyl-D-glucosamine 2-epimerase family)